MDKIPINLNLTHESAVENIGTKIIIKKQGQEKKRITNILGIIEDGFKLLSLLIFKGKF